MEIAIIILLIILIMLVMSLGVILILKNKNNTSNESFSALGMHISDTQDKIGKYQAERLNHMDTQISRLSTEMNSKMERISKSMGEIHSLTNGVEDLKKVLSNVKTRGILGEWQLGAILSEIMSPSQYEENICTVPNSKNPVEFAIKLPGEQHPVYLPIDSKFPLTAYYNLIDAYDGGDVTEIDECTKLLLKRIEQFAKDIHTKYISPPYTTDFAILFVPIEGLYAELIKKGLCEILQNKYKIIIAGPSTLAALLNSLQIGFKTLAVNEKAQDISHQLNSIKTEFQKFEAILQKTQQHIHLAQNDIDELLGVRTRQILRQFDKMEK